jgi:hypothetical protein
MQPHRIPYGEPPQAKQQTYADPVDTGSYKSNIGALQYMLHTRPDLAFAFGYLSQFMEASREDHLTIVKRVLRYMAGMRDFRLYYTQHEENRPSLVGYSDADMVGDIHTRKSTSNVIFFLFFLNDNPITWQGTKKKIVAMSSYEAEYIVPAAVAWQGIWLGRLLTKMLRSSTGVSELCIDNQ